MIEKNLEKFGFSPSETKIYLYLLKKENSYANEISSQTGLNRTNVYEALDRLVAKGVVSFITRNKVKQFEAKSIDSLKTLIRDREFELKKTRENFLREINELKKSLPTSKESLEASIFTGRKGLKMLFEEILEVGKPTCFLASRIEFKSFFGPYFEQWHKRRIDKGITQRTIFSKKFKKVVIKRKLQKIKYKFLSYEYTNPSTTCIYGNIVLLIQWSKEPLAIRIQNKEIAKSHLNYFNLLWKSN
ncbi:MAG: TrmB family transcriptional regulator [Candidatus Diapherotrites archaeon]|nr:TrmB family transcriptional regulator [Candidatus Diapherotrites archaeon]